MSNEIYYMSKRLEKLAQNCGVMQQKNSEAPQVDTSKMSKYEKQQYAVAVIMQRLRGNISELDSLGDKAPLPKRTELGQAIRKDLEKMKAEAAKARAIAKEDGKREEYETLITHVKKTEDLYRQRFRASDDTVAALNVVNGRSSQVTQLDSEMSQLGKPMMNLRDDEEFQMFFQQVQRNDELMDKALDRISAGVASLHQNALEMGQELKKQNAILDETQEKTEKVSTKLNVLNKRLKKTIKEVQKDKLCIYAICFILLLALGGVIYWQISANKNGG